MRQSSTRYSLSPDQRAAIDQLADPLPEAMRRSFLLTVSSNRELSRGANKFASDQKVSAAIDRALRAVGVAR